MISEVVVLTLHWPGFLIELKGTKYEIDPSAPRLEPPIVVCWLSTFSIRLESSLGSGTLISICFPVGYPL